MNRPLEESVLNNLISELGEDFPIILSIYLDKLPTRLEAIATAMAVHDREQMCQAAHALKGSSRQFGASRLAELCHSLENQCKSGQQEEMDSLFQSLRQEAAAVRASLEAMAQSDASS